VMNYLLSRACLGFFVGDNLLRAEVARSGYHSIATLDANEFADSIEEMLDPYPRPVTEVQFNLLGSHDTPRFKTLARGDNSAYRLSTLFQMTFPGAPSIYYGDEIGMEGGHDPGCRGAFPWDERLWDRELRDYVKRCISLRQRCPALRRGDFSWLFKGQGVVAYSRRLGDEIVVVVINARRQPVTVDVPLRSLEEGTRLRNPWQEGDAEVAVSHGALPGIHVPARSGVVLVPSPR